MADHLWGDEWKYWDTLYFAMDYITSTFNAKTGMNLLLKEKYGTLRYEGVYPYSDNYPNHWKILGDIIKQATVKWPEIKEEIEEDYFD